MSCKAWLFHPLAELCTLCNCYGHILCAVVAPPIVYIKAALYDHPLDHSVHTGLCSCLHWVDHLLPAVVQVGGLKASASAADAFARQS